MFDKKKEDTKKPAESNLKKHEELDDESLGQVTGGVPGRTNLYNLLAAVSVLKDIKEDK